MPCGPVRLILSALLWILATPALAVAPVSPAILVQKSLDHLGGEESVRRGAIGLELRGTYDLGTARQGRVQGLSEPTPLIERIHLDYAGGRAGYERRGHNYTHSVQHVREIRTGGGPTGFIDLLAGSGGWPPFAGPADSHLRAARILPQVILVDALDRKGSLRSAGKREDAQLIEYSTAAGDRLRVAIGPDLLPRWAEGHIDHPLIGETTLRWEWSQYRFQGGLRIPAHARTLLDGRPLKQVAVSYEQGAFSDLLTAPPQVAMGPRPTKLREFVPYGDRPISMETLAPGVHVVRSLRPGFNAMFVEYDDHVVAIDAPAGWFELGLIPPEDDSRGGGTGELGKKLLRAIQQTTAKPVTHVILTHHHSDHIGGILPLLRAGAVPVGSAAALAAVERLAGGLPAGAIEVDREWRHGEGARELRAIRLPPGNPKAEGFLVAYLPQAKLMYVTGFFYPVAQGQEPPTESLPLAAWFIGWLDGSGLAVDTLYNLHGGKLEQWQWQLHRRQHQALPRRQIEQRGGAD